MVIVKSLVENPTILKEMVVMHVLTLLSPSMVEKSFSNVHTNASKLCGTYPFTLNEGQHES